MAFELCTPEKDNYLNAISKDFTAFSMKHGIYLRSMGNTIYVMPPYCITSKELKKIYSVIVEFIKKYVKEKEEA
jgi:adenosylmethionine-8-amino-7-oxononanoate aminotransferase